MAAIRGYYTAHVLIMHLEYQSVCISVPVGDNILEADKQLPSHVQFVDGGVDGVLTRSSAMESVSIGNH